VALSLASLWDGKKTFFILQDDDESAGYLYQDLIQLLGEDPVYYFPPSFKRSYKNRQPDAGNLILRTEALHALSQQQPCFIVAYPESLLEKVSTPEELKDNTLNLSVGERVDTHFIQEVLQEYGFERVDYVYEPGQYSVRGSLIDVYSWSNELPYRIDFFGDEIESIRTFDIENQLSKERIDQIRLISKENESKASTNVLSYLKEDDVLCWHDIDLVYSKIERLQNESGACTESFLSSFQTLACSWRWIEYGTHFQSEREAVVFSFQMSPQPLFGLNFDFVSQTFHTHLEEGYRLFLLSDSPKQIERLRAIFEDREDHIHFEPVNKTLHEGFIDHELKVACYTDHQLFERYHKYNLRSEKARNGKLALSLKEIVQLHIGDYVVHIDYVCWTFRWLIQNGDQWEDSGSHQNHVQRRG
jgi:transcription-repair coupling factor (superfamily II helicase)